MKNTVGERLKKARENKNLTQAEVAEKLGVTRSVVARYESGINDPPTENIITLAEIYEVTTDYLLGKTDLMVRESRFAYGPNSNGADIEEALSLAKKIKSLPDAEKRIIEIIISSSQNQSAGLER